MAAATLTSKGQVTIPKPVRDALKLRAGDKLEFRVQNDRSAVMERPRKIDAMEIAGMFKSKIKRKRPVTVEEMDEGIREAVAAAYRRSVRK
jgi:AbrB family looped-hinge helix DNA binding protein